MQNKDLKIGDLLYRVCGAGISHYRAREVKISGNCVSVKIHWQNKDYKAPEYYHDSPFLYGHKNGSLMVADGGEFYLREVDAESRVITKGLARKWSNLIYHKQEAKLLLDEIDKG